MGIVPTFTVEREGYGWAVCKDGVPIKRPASEALAHEIREKLERKARSTKRACMCCRTVFLSEGPHNRLCNRCRHLGANAEDRAV